MLIFQDISSDDGKREGAGKAGDGRPGKENGWERGAFFAGQMISATKENHKILCGHLFAACGAGKRTKTAECLGKGRKKGENRG